MTSRGNVSPSTDKSKNYRPSDMAHVTDRVALTLEQIRAHEQNKVLSGLFCKAPTTGSTQTTGDAETDWNIDIEAGVVVVGGVVKQFAVQADFAVHDTTQVPGLDSLDTVKSALICELIAGTPTLKVVHGTAATTASGAAAGPTRAQIVAALATATNPWIQIAELTINRTGDTTVTQSEDNTPRPVLGVNVDPTFGDF